MTKNSNGGKRAKTFARKHATSAPSATLLSTNELERYAIVTKLLGNGMFYATTDDDQNLIGHIRNKFKGRYKHSNLITVGAIILLGLRDWENPPKHADLLHVYETNEIHTIHSQHNIGGLLHISNNLSSFQSAGQSSNVNDTLLFTTHDQEDEIAMTGENNDTSNIVSKSLLLYGNGEKIDIEDI